MPHDVILYYGLHKSYLNAGIRFNQDKYADKIMITW